MQRQATPATVDPEFSERRNFSRVNVDLLGRFMREDRTEYPCRTENMSPGDALILSPVQTNQHEKIIVYVDHLGRLEGEVVRVFDGGFVLALKGSERKRERLAAQLTFLANRKELDLPEDRRHERVQPENPFIDVIMEDGRHYPVKVIDLSVSGAAVMSAVRPAVGARITLGSTPGRVVRHIEDGFAIEFASLSGGDLHGPSSSI